jgi:DNA-nicking Smr family endonuclease
VKKKSKFLTAEEEGIWKNYSKNISKLCTENPSVTDKTKIRNKKLEQTTSVKNLIIDGEHNKDHKSLNSSNSKVLLDRKIHHNLKSGRINPSRSLDLHGLRYEDAKSKVIIFINSAFMSEHRLVLVITGKGKNLNSTQSFFDEERSGILRKAFPSWLENTKIKPLILNVTSAHSSHGGSGAFYVYLRKKKSQRT